ncbi:MAG: GNAT family N-acetyltransferase [Bacteroidales bacterium]
MITVRKAKETDSEAVISFQEAMAMETEGLRLDRTVLTPGVRRVFDDPSKGCYYVAEAEGSVIASLLITYEWSDWRNADVWWFQSVYVKKEYRRKGIFRLMYSHIKGEAEANGIAGLRLYVETNNIVAQKTYESMGMTGEHYRMYEWLK